ncbi:hypothetical protein JCM8202_002295 [Rhodotorula sphaerocarpa]
MPSTRGNNAPRRSKRVTDNEKQAIKLKAQQDAKAAKAKAAGAKKKAAAKLKKEDVEGAVATVKKTASKAAKRVKNEVVKPAAKKVAAAAGVATDSKSKAKKPSTTKKTTTTTATKKAAPAARTTKKTTSSTGKAASAAKPKAAPAKRAPPKARGAVPERTKKATATKAKAEKEDKAADAHYKVGDAVEDVTLHDEDDKPVSLKSLFEDKHLVIFSYPKADTPGCTTQACGYRDVRSEYESEGATVIGISLDKPTAQLKWKSKHELGYSLLSDPQGDFLKKLGWSEKTKRCHWVIEKGGKLAEAKLGVKPADDPKNALEFVKSLKA